MEPTTEVRAGHAFLFWTGLIIFYNDWTETYISYFVVFIRVIVYYEYFFLGKNITMRTGLFTSSDTCKTDFTTNYQIVCVCPPSTLQIIPVSLTLQQIPEQHILICQSDVAVWDLCFLFHMMNICNALSIYRGL